MASHRMIGGLIFKLFDVFGEYLPTDSMIENILKDRATDEAKQQFCKVSNKYCLLFEIDCWNEMPPDIPGNELTRQRLELDRNFMGHEQAMSAITGHSFERLVKYQYVMNWYQAVAGNFSGGNPQSIRRNKIPLDVSRKTGEMQRDESFLIYPEFREADDYYREFYDSIASFCKTGNVEMINLSNSQGVIFKDRASLEEKMRTDGIKIVNFFCKYCQKYHVFDSCKVRDTCGSSECKRDRDASRKPRKNLKGWVKDPSVRPKKCLRCENMQRHLNIDLLCLECYLKSKDTLV